MGDLAFADHSGLYYLVDVKSHRLGTRFNMPNLTSVERLARFYEDDANFFILLMVKYSIDGIRVSFEQVHFVPIEYLSWQCLRIGALGWGQIQISDSNVIEIIPGNLRKDWMIELCDRLLTFYPGEIKKAERRLSYFNGIRQRWLRA
jgi:hypothetical protein